MAKVEVYTTPVCYYCSGEAAFGPEGVAFEEVDVSRDAELRRKMVRGGGRCA